MRKPLSSRVFGVLIMGLALVAVSPGSSAGSGSPLAAPESPVADAAKAGDVDAVRALLRDGADVNAAHGDGMTALHWAAVNGDPATMRVLLYAGAAVEPKTRLGGYTPLHVAAGEGRGETVEILLEAGADVGALTSTGVSALHLAAQAGVPQAVRALREGGADIDLRDETHGRTPLMFAAANNRLDAMRVLLAAGADVHQQTEIIDYVERGRRDSRERQTRQRIVDAAKPPEPRGARGGRGSATGPRATPPGAPATPAAPTQANQPPPDPDIVDPLAAAIPPPPDPDEPPTGSAAQADPPDPDDPPDVRRSAAPGEATEATRPAVDPNAPRSLSNTEQIGKQGGFTALHYAAREGHAAAADLLLGAGAELNGVTGGDQSSPMLVAIINGNFDMALSFLQRGADPNLASEDGAAPLFAVLNNEWALRTWYPQPTASQQQETSYLDLMRALLDAGADPNARVNSHIWYAAYNAGRMGVDFTGATAFWRAAYSTDVAAMKLLVAYGADPDISTMKLRSSRRERPEDPSGRPPVPAGGPHVHPLHAATGVGYGTSRVGQQHRHVPGGWLPAVKYLVEELGVDVNVIDADGYSAVHNAAARGDNEVIEFLVEHGADVTLVSRRGQTTVDMANGPQQRVQPFPETIALLEGLGAKNNHNCLSC